MVFKGRLTPLWFFLLAHIICLITFAVEDGEEGRVEDGGKEEGKDGSY